MRVHARASLAIGLAHLPPARVEPGSRHRGHRLPIPREQVPDRLALAVMGILGDPIAPGEHEPPPAAHATRRSATAPSRCGAGTRPRSPSPPFSLPAPGSRTPGLDPVMRDEPPEHLHHHDPVPRDPVRRAGGVVRAPAPAAPRRCARTPRAAPRRTHSAFPPGQRHRVPHVRIRKRRHQAVHVRPAPRNHGLSQTKIRLHHARRPLQPPDTRHREADAPASSASRTAARSGTSRQTPAPRPACHTRAWPYAAACAA